MPTQTDTIAAIAEEPHGKRTPDAIGHMNRYGAYRVIDFHDVVKEFNRQHDKES